MNGNVKKGRVLSIYDNTARVAPMSNIDLVSRNMQIAENIDIESLKKGSTVAYVEFDDYSGFIIAKLE